MRVDVFINPFAGRARTDSLKNGIGRSLFRCELHFHECQTTEEFGLQIKSAIENKTQALVLCGGDGTLNQALQTIMPIRLSGLEIPPLCIISSGTANDFATELKLSNAIDEAAHCIVEGQTRTVDVLRAQSNDTQKFFLTNGGLGVPALTADFANSIKTWVKKRSTGKNSSSGFLNQSLEKIGPLLYDILFGLKYAEWSSDGWKVEIISQGQKMETQSSIVLINNQTRLGSGFMTAPFTKNNDGYFNILSFQKNSKISDLRAVLDVRMGSFPESGSFHTFETKSVSLKAKGSKKLTFFADGEILFRNSDEIDIDCISPGISVYGSH